jgi:hydroxybutyrate-dimer hydrolase
MMAPRRFMFMITIAIAAAALSGCSSSNNDDSLAINEKPAFIPGPVTRTSYDGVLNDLLTGGLGKTGLGALATAPLFIDPSNPTVSELRTRAIFNNYRALVDTTTNGGYGTLYGPNINSAGVNTSLEGRIAGDEYLAFADDGTGTVNVAMMVQIPTTFNTNDPCIVTASSSGSRGIYGAIGTAGEWGLKRGCAVAYTDKGTGNGGHDLAANTVYGLTGLRTTVAGAGKNSGFTAALTPAELAAFNGAFPNRWAYKHAHSQQNPEKDWGIFTLQAIRFAFYVINDRFSPDVGGGQKIAYLTPGNTLVIASSVSNGAGAALAAAELDTDGLIDGVAVGEPQIQLNLPSTLSIKRGATAVSASGKSLYDIFTIANLYQPCAAYAAAAAGAPGLAFVNATIAANRCAALAAGGLVTGATTADQSNDALSKLLAAGWESDSTPLQASHYAFATVAIAVTYANTYARASVKDNLCGFSFAATPAGVPAPLATASTVQLFASGNGIPPSGGVNIVNNNSVGGAFLDGTSVSPSTGKQDFNVDGALCLRSLLTGASAQAAAVNAGINQVKRSGNLRGKPAIIVHGRSDALVPVNHASRAYLALNRSVETGSKLNYYEVTNAQHFDAFIGNAALAGYDTRFVPLHRYFNQAMDLMYAHLKTGAALPASQVVRTTPRGGSPGTAPAITAANVPPISATPAAADTITFSGNVLTVPD